MRATLLVGCVALLCGAMAVSSSAQSGIPLDRARQLVVVITPDWGATRGTLHRYQRTGTRWSRFGEPIPVVVGRSGLGWGLGSIAATPRPDDPMKREGDGRTPAGIFPIGAAFGFDQQKPEWTRLPYLALTESTECVDDAGSSYYNAVVDRLATLSPNWSSSEKMRSIDVYRWGVVVDQNAARERGGGSCIFLHIWKGPDRPTAGCTAMEQAKLEELMRWLDPAAHPMMVALPSAPYDRLRSTWKLP